MKRRLISMLLAAVLLVICAAPAMAAAPKVKKTEYDGYGVVEVEFTTKNVKYKGTSVVVKDAAGKRLSTKILEKESDEIAFRVTGVKAGSKYTYVISGVRAGKSGSYGKVTGSFRTPTNVPKIKKVKYDSIDKELEVDFTTKVQFKNLAVTVKNASGKRLSVSKLEKDSDGVEMKVKGMKKGQRYTVTVSDVRVKGVGKYISVSKTFVA